MRPPTWLCSGHDAVSAAAGSVGATDLFVFRRITADRFVHVGGLGRGEGWAGNVDLILAAEDLAREAMTTGVPVFARAAEPVHVFGPYYQREAVFVPLPPDVIVVFGAAESGALCPRRSRDRRCRRGRSRRDRAGLDREAARRRARAPPRSAQSRPDGRGAHPRRHAARRQVRDRGALVRPRRDLRRRARRHRDGRGRAGPRAGGRILPPRHADAARGSGRATHLHPGLRDRAPTASAQRLRRDLALRTADRNAAVRGARGHAHRGTPARVHDALPRGRPPARRVGRAAAPLGADPARSRGPARPGRARRPDGSPHAAAEPARVGGADRRSRTSRAARPA